MTDEPVDIIPYRVEYSGNVLDGLRALAERARDRGLGREAIEAMQTIYNRLRVFPQFGQPLRDLAGQSGQEWIAVVPPLIVRYLVFDEHRVVSVVQPMQPLPGPGL